MDYFSVIVLILVIFTFVSDRNVKSIDKIKNEKQDLDLEKEINYIKENLEIIKIESKNMTYDNFFKTTNDFKKEYILLQNSRLKLSRENIDTLISNYVINNKKTCGFNLLYSYTKKKWSLKRIYIDIINYLNIFNKTELSTYGVIICKKEELKQDEKTFEKNLISYTTSEITNIDFSDEEIKTSRLKKIYIKKLSKADISISIKIFLLIISGSIITTNLIYSVFNVNNNINGLIISAVIYYCYSYIIRYIYRPIGKQRVIATYIFPIYFITYIIVGVYTALAKVIKKVHAT